MQIRIVAVGQRITEWAQSAVSDYLSRFPRDFRVELRGNPHRAARRPDARAPHGG